MIKSDVYFKIFKIEKISDITPKELKKRYRILVKKYHPDRKPHGDSKKFRLIHNSYEFLKNEMKILIQKENKKFFNEDFFYYSDDSIYSISKKRWVKIKGKKINIKV